MAAPAKLDKPERPLLTRDKFDIEPDAEVEITTEEGYMIRGNCFRNPKKTSSTNVVELVNCKRFDPATGKSSACGFQRFFKDNITKLNILVGKREFNPQDIPERLMSTKIIMNEKEFKRMFAAIEDVKIIGLSMVGINVSRDGEVGWICIYTHGILICIDVITLEKILKEQFWNLLEMKIFMNPSLIKVVHDIRPMVDFLYHTKAMRTKNLYCTQLTEVYIRYHMNRKKPWPRDSRAPTIEGTQCNWLAKPLSYSLQKFLYEDVNTYELPLLKEYEAKDFSLHNSMMKRPMDRSDPNYKCVAISMKYLLELYEVQTKLLVSHMDQVFQAQVKLMLRGNMADYYKHITEPSYVELSVHEVMLRGKPYIVSKPNEAGPGPEPDEHDNPTKKDEPEENNIVLL